ncbi:putative membrane protein [Peptoniphilus sp. ING2-D1G]|nr:putative membrane protein [Peptoniphilus sp. ING2-D1G]
MLMDIIIAALVNFFTRALPFIFFKEGNVPKIITYLGKILPGAIMAILVVYCLRFTDFSTSVPFPEIIAVTLCIVLHKAKHNILLSIGGSTIVYMILLNIM